MSESGLKYRTLSDLRFMCYPGDLLYSQVSELWQRFEREPVLIDLAGLASLDTPGRVEIVLKRYLQLGIAMRFLKPENPAYRQLESQREACMDYLEQIGWDLVTEVDRKLDCYEAENETDPEAIPA